MGKPLKKNLWLVIESSRTFLRNQKAWGSSSFFYGPFVSGLWEDTAYTLGKEMATHSSILAWRIPMDREAWQATVHGVTKSQT